MGRIVGVLEFEVCRHENSRFSILVFVIHSFILSRKREKKERKKEKKKREKILIVSSCLNR